MTDNDKKSQKNSAAMKKQKDKVDSNIEAANIERGVVILLTGDGKGKSSSAFGEDRDTGNTLAKRPEKSAIFAADRHIGKWDIGASWRAHSERFDTVSNTIGTAGYGLVDIRAGYQISNNLKAQLKLNNIFDKDYQTNSRYNQDGFNGFATLNYSL